MFYQGTPRFYCPSYLTTDLELHLQLFFPRSSVDILRPLTDYRRTKNRFNDRDAGINLISHCQKKLYIYNSLAIGFIVIDE